MAPKRESPPAFDVALSSARQILYRFASLTFADPRSRNWDRLHDPANGKIVTEAAEWIRGESAAVVDSLGPGERSLSELDVALVLARLPQSREALEQAYVRVFGLLSSGPCPPHETEYIGSKFVFRRSQELADVSGFYRAFGLRPARWHPEQQDHIALELEFMAFLVELERRAAAGAGSECEQRVAICRDAQMRFLRDHLGWWTPAFAKIVGREDAGGFYHAAGVFLAALIPAERGILGVEPSRVPAEPTSIEPPEACEGCMEFGEPIPTHSAHETP